MDKIIIGGDGLKGDLTTCKTELLITSINKESVLSPSQITEYSVQDSCTRQIISKYSVPEISCSGIILITIIFLFSWMVLDITKTIIRGYK